MICFVDIEHEKVLLDPARRTGHLAACLDIQLRLEEISGRPCIVQRFERVTRRRLAGLGVEALVISGNATDWAEYAGDAWTEMHAIIRAAEMPIIGFCGGHQLIAMAHGAAIGPIRPLRPGEPDVTKLSRPGFFKEWGFVPVRVLQADPIFAGLGPTPIFLEAHYWEVKTLPPGFTSLAATDECPIQAMRQAGKPVYGTQFHPEAYTEVAYERRSQLVNLTFPEGCAEPQPAGRKLLENFFRVAGIIE
ncbi:MAG: hypothetical protein AUK03_15500 [Anaerolineae bacterium CG2_30_64_16]|nr:MAG: hypothetical protein AUK03_15500 [Anaerolineae bacterium CG2_30_64_16]